MNPIILDVIAFALILFFLWRGCEKGFVLTLCGFLAVFVALIGASILSNALAEPVAKAVEPVIERRIQDALTEAIQQTEFVSVDGGVAQSPEELPLSAVIQQLKDSGLYRSFANAFQSAVDSGVAEVTANAAKSLAHFVAVQIARTVLFALAFFAVLIAWSFLSRALDLVARLPVLSSVNRWGGGAIGLCKGVLIVMAAAWLLQDSFIPKSMVEETILLKFLCSVNPVSFFL